MYKTKEPKITKKIKVKKLLNDFPEDRKLLEKVSVGDMSVVIIPEHEGEEVGYLTLDLINGEDSLTELNAALIYDVFVSEEFRGMGFGRYMVLEAEYFAKNFNLDGLMIHFDLDDYDNIEEAKNFISKAVDFGFKPMIHNGNIYYYKQINHN